jgi:hypothetical protein
MKRIPQIIFLPLLISVILAWSSSLSAEEKTIGPGEYKGVLVNEGSQAYRVSPIKAGQTLQVLLAQEWTAEKTGKVKVILETAEGAKLAQATLDLPDPGPVSLEWTSNSEPKPAMYSVRIQGTEGTSPAEVLGPYNLEVRLWDQNDGNSGTDAPESYEKALPLPISEPGAYLFEECFISGTADVYDIYKISLRPNHSLSLRAVPLQWKGTGKGGVRWEFFQLLNKSLRRMKEGQNPLSQTAPFVVKIFHSRVKADPKPATFYLLVKMEGDSSLVYSLQANVKEGR